MKNKFSIGEMARLHNISVQTLRYYDKIGLLKPGYVDDTNGYRYYTAQQFDRLDTIRYLKFLGLSLTEIKLCLDNYNVANARELLLCQKKALNQKIRELNLIKKRIDNKLSSLTAGISVLDFEQVGIKSIEDRDCVLLEFNIPANDLDLIVWGRELGNTVTSNFAAFSLVCVILSLENILSRNFSAYKAVGFIGHDIENKAELIKTIPAGNYAYIYHRGSYDKIAVSYERLLNFMENNYCKISGDALEIGLINSSLTSNEKEFITEIQIPVKSC